MGQEGISWLLVQEKNMKWFLKLERKFGKYAISNIMYFMLGCYIIGLAIQWFAPSVDTIYGEVGFYDAYLSLNVAMILKGQIWRLFTFLLDPPSTSILFAAIMIWMYFQIGQVLEQVWGSFRFNVYLFMGILMNIAAAFLAYFLFGLNTSMGTFYINLALFLAYAVTFPDMEFRLFFIIPIKAKYLAIVDGIYYGFMVILSLKAHSYGTTIEIVVSLLNFLIFFLITRDYRRVSPKNMARKNHYRSQVKKGNMKKGIHRCAVCGITDLDDPNMTFRYCSKCAGTYEYCSEHLYTHRHVGSDNGNMTS